MRRESRCHLLFHRSLSQYLQGSHLQAHVDTSGRRASNAQSQETSQRTPLRNDSRGERRRCRRLPPSQEPLLHDRLPDGAQPRHPPAPFRPAQRHRSLYAGRPADPDRGRQRGTGNARYNLDCRYPRLQRIRRFTDGPAGRRTPGKGGRQRENRARNGVFFGCLLRCPAGTLAKRHLRPLGRAVRRSARNQDTGRARHLEAQRRHSR